MELFCLIRMKACPEDFEKNKKYKLNFNQEKFSIIEF